ncbi:MAG: cadmium-translocating P-type ATPase [Bauldia sp.]|nr:cadmium-translocating P-type ATPase [Bauldia sp.]
MTEAETLKYRIGGMDCAACATKIETAVLRLPGVGGVGVSLAAGTMTVRRDGAIAVGSVERQVTALGYSITSAGAGSAGGTLAVQSHDGHDHGDAGHHHGHQETLDGAWWRTPKARLIFISGAALAVAYAAGLVFPAIGHWAFVLAMAVGLAPIARRAVAAALAGTPFSIETLMTIAAVGAVIIGATEEAAIVVLLFLIGELLEGIAASRARASIRDLADLVPKTALVETDEGVREIPADAVAVGATIVVRPGDRIAADGEVLDGASAVNEAPVTGESVPVTRGEGDAVYAGTINGEAVLRVRVTAAAADNTIARIVRLVEEAQESKAPTERFIDRFARVYTPGVMAVAALVAVVPPLLFGAGWDEWIYKGLAILLIGCPCALVISTPAAIAAGLSAGARRGLLVKGGVVLEKLRTVTTVAFDKTGTLTDGQPRVTDIVGLAMPEARVLSLAAALESRSSHPIAAAILARAGSDRVPVPPAADARAVPGKGVTGRVGGQSVYLASPRAAEDAAALDDGMRDRIAALNDEGRTVSVLLVDGTPAGLIAIRDEPRADAAAGLAALRKDGISTVMLTGDNARTARAIGKDLGIEVRAELMPEDKQRIVREQQGRGQVVAKVGDGINDAPALAAADVGVAMGGGTDVALETADAAILHGRVGDIAALIDLSRATIANIRQNITVALGLKAVFLITTIAGITGMWPAILADTGATVLVTMNAMRLLAWRPASS